METLEPARVARAKRLRGVYAIVNEAPHMLAVASAALDAGIGIIQYRAKAGINQAALRIMRALTHEAGALLIVNDDWRIAAHFGCDGVHLGPDDDGFDDVSAARRAMPKGLIGLSCGTLLEIDRANSMDIDYAGVGAVFSTASKDDAGEPIGIDGLARICDHAQIPVCAIGGLTAATLPSVRSAGAQMAAVISALAQAPNASRAAHELVTAWPLPRLL